MLTQFEALFCETNVIIVDSPWGYWGHPTVSHLLKIDFFLGSYVKMDVCTHHF